MKYAIIIAIGILTARLLFAQGIVGSGTHRYSKYPSYNPNTPPPMVLPDAYALAQKTIGNATNTFYCITASCVEMSNAGFTGWTFAYANTNGQRGRVMVYFDGQAGVMAHEGEVIIQH